MADGNTETTDSLRLVRPVYRPVRYARISIKILT